MFLKQCDLVTHSFLGFFQREVLRQYCRLDPLWLINYSTRETFMLIVDHEYVNTMAKGFFSFVTSYQAPLSSKGAEYCGGN